tara:strand:- start:10554 stop:10862 length:309 start_codon:yes stop_codon:yes gene_type:complete
MDLNDRDGEWWDELAELNPDAVILDGFDSCIIGYASRQNMQAVLVYDEDKMIEVMSEQLGGDTEGAIDYLSYNTWGLWAGEGTPMVLRRYDEVHRETAHISA